MAEDTVARHTPGRWIVVDGWYVVSDRDRVMVATTSGACPKQTEANARLIALAPEMAEALRGLMKFYPVNGDFRPKTSEEREMVDAFLAACSIRDRLDDAPLTHMGVPISRADGP